MASLEAGLDGIGGAFNKALNYVEAPLFALGFAYGATADLSYSGTFTSAIEARVSDTIARVTGMQVQIGASKSSQNFKFNATGFLNKGIWGMVGSWMYKEAGLPYAREIYKLVFPASAGFTIGGLFDDRPGSGSGPEQVYQSSPVQNVFHSSQSSYYPTASTNLSLAQVVSEISR